MCEKPGIATSDVYGPFPARAVAGSVLSRSPVAFQGCWSFLERYTLSPATVGPHTRKKCRLRSAWDTRQALHIPGGAAARAAAHARFCGHSGLCSSFLKRGSRGVWLKTKKDGIRVTLRFAVLFCEARDSSKSLVHSVNTLSDLHPTTQARTRTESNSPTCMEKIQLLES